MALRTASVAVLAGLGGVLAGFRFADQQATVVRASFMQTHYADKQSSFNYMQTRREEDLKRMRACYARFVHQLADPRAVQKFVNSDTEAQRVADVEHLSQEPGGDYYDGWYNRTDEFYTAEQRETARDMIRIFTSPPNGISNQTSNRWWMQRNAYMHDPRLCDVEEEARADLAQAGLLRSDCQRSRPEWIDLPKPCYVNGKKVE